MSFFAGKRPSEDPCVQWIYRESNGAADVLAKYAATQAMDPEWLQVPIFQRATMPDDLYNMNLGFSSVWGTQPPPFLSPVLYMDNMAIFGIFNYGSV
ncbi:hypothetical protein FRX31_004569 [Thalictrum thalictroides]|uniref:RNase H type-1 domain-containing protein n=1 Tax=Thalictrum thalictroides TaxID=46969 RepID=A0A7J6XAJ2_THATH|nr:hypothetical protein FRX31_004569 [Thalictrum thalictroides]